MEHIYPFIVAGNKHTLILSSLGEVYSVGSNTYGQLGLHDFEDRTYPQKIDFLHNISYIACSAFASYAVDENGYVYSWGLNLHGELGVGDNENRSEPTLIDSINNVWYICCGYSHCFAFTITHDIYCWGNNVWGQHARSNNEDTNVPVHLNCEECFSIISCGNFHSVGISYEGLLYSWGCNQNRQFGIPSWMHTSYFKPLLIDSLNDKYFCFISCGDHHSFAISDEECIFTWGQNEYGELGLDNFNEVYEPSLINNYEYIICSASNQSSFGITKDGEVHSWGLNLFCRTYKEDIEKGRLGVGYTVIEKTCSNKKVYCLENISKISICRGITIVKSKDNILYYWGDNQKGQLGNNTIINQRIPTTLRNWDTLLPKTMSSFLSRYYTEELNREDFDNMLSDIKTLSIEFTSIKEGIETIKGIVLQENYQQTELIPPELAIQIICILEILDNKYTSISIYRTCMYSLLTWRKNKDTFIEKIKDIKNEGILTEKNKFIYYISKYII